MVITKKTLERIRNPTGKTDNVLLEWEIALDLYQAGRIQLLVVHHAELPKPTTDKAKEVFLASIPDEVNTPKQLDEGGMLQPRMTARQILG